MSAPTMRSPIIVAVVGGIIFALGIVGSAVAGSWARNTDPDYLVDCLIVTPDPNCESRAAARESARTVVLVLESLILVGLVTIIVAFVMDVRSKRRGTSPPGA